jgi:hypothetical protein
MSTLQHDNLTLEQLLSAVKRLSPIELHEFTRQFVEWQEQNGVSVKHRKIPEYKLEAEEERVLLARIEENSHLPVTEQRRYERLRRKCERRTLNESELAEYQSLLQQLEARNVKRIEALIALAKRRGTTLRGIMAELGLKGA